nr:RNA-directed DNA polymerase, eukaryota, reverse transcriptase zinc-binding domain protein [Tanacetum cinerariifolium]
MNKRDHPDGAKGVYKTRSEDTHKDLGQRIKTNSYAGVVKQTNIQPKLVVEFEPALVLDNSCMLQRDFSMSLMGKVKEFGSISNLLVVLANESFENLKFIYLGGCWVLIDFKSNSAKENFQNHTGVGSWFALLQQAYKSFHIDERVTWVDIKGIPLQAWTQNTFAKIASNEIDDIDRLVKNLCTIWFGWMRLHANVVRFQRTPMNKRDHPDGAKGVYKTRSEDTHKDLGQRMKTNSYAGVVKQTNIQPKLVVESEPALVLDNSCMLQRDFSMSLMGKVKEFGSISNLPVVLANESFENLKFIYLDGCWVLIDFKSNSAKENFQNHTGVGSWFALLQQAYKSFHIDERVTWVDIKGTPLQAWTQNTFAKIASNEVSKVYWIRAKETLGWVPEFMEEELAPNESDDEMLDEDLNMIDEALQKETKLDVHSDEEEVPKSSFVHEQMHVNDDEQGQNNIETEVSKSEDPFRIYDILNKKVDNKEGEDNSNCSISYPLGFTPLEDDEVELNKSDDKEGHVKGTKVEGFITESDGRFGEGGTNYGNKVEVEKAWNDYKRSDDNVMTRLYNKLKHLKQHIRVCIKAYKVRTNSQKKDIKDELTFIDLCIDQRDMHADLLFKRKVLMKSLQEIEHLATLEIAQKSKVKWSIEGDENTKYFHGILNKKRIQSAIRGVLTNVVWIDDLVAVKNAFLLHFKDRFSTPSFPRGSNSSFIALIPKMQDAKMVKDFRPITLIGSLYKIIAKILANRLRIVLGDLVNEVQSAFVANRNIQDGLFILNELMSWCKKKKKQTMIFKVDFEKAYALVRWDYLDVFMKKFGFGIRWCRQIQSCLCSSRGLILVNGSPTSEFQFQRGLK